MTEVELHCTLLGDHSTGILKVKGKKKTKHNRREELERRESFGNKKNEACSVS